MCSRLLDLLMLPIPCNEYLVRFERWPLAGAYGEATILRIAAAAVVVVVHRVDRVVPCSGCYYCLLDTIDLGG